MSILIRITAPHFVAGVVVGERAAPIINYMARWRFAQIDRYCLSHGWKVEQLK